MEEEEREKDHDTRDAYKGVCLFVWPFLSLEDLRKARLLTYSSCKESTLMCSDPRQEIIRLFGSDEVLHNHQEKERRYFIALHVARQMCTKKVVPGIFSGTPMMDWTYRRGFDWVSEPWNPFIEIDSEAEQKPKLLPMTAMFFAWCLCTFKAKPYVSHHGTETCALIDPPLPEKVPKSFEKGLRRCKFPLLTKHVIQAPHVYFATRAWLKRVSKEECVCTRVKHQKIDSWNEQGTARVLNMRDVFSEEFLTSREMTQSKLFNVMDYHNNWFLRHYVECSWTQMMDRNDILSEKRKGYIVLKKKRKDTSNIRFM